MNETEILRHIRTAYGAMIAEAAAKHRHRPEVMAGIIMRETQGGLSPLLDRPGPGGRGDRDKEGRYHGHGLCQIDDRSFPAFCAGTEWKDAAKNIEMGACVVGRTRAFLAARTLGLKLTNDDLEKAAIAAYNAGEGRVLNAIEQGRDPDSCTAHCNYAAAVLRYAELYLNLAIGDVYPIALKSCGLSQGGRAQ
jgi:hypothetical protein